MAGAGGGASLPASTCRDMTSSYRQRSHEVSLFPCLQAVGSEHWWRLREAALLAFGNVCSALAEAEEAGGPHVDSSAIQARSVFRSF